jgi:hypothetical protein
MAITRAQQVRQMLKKGSKKPVEQAGVMNFMPSEMVTVPKIAKSSPNTPTAKLAYITPEEQDILVDLNLYGSLDGKPNRGPGGIPSLEGDFGTPGGFVGGGGGRQDNDVSGRRDTGTGDYRDSTRADDVAARKEYEVNRKKREAEEKKKRDKEAEKKARKEVRDFLRDAKKRDKKKRDTRIQQILKGTYQPTLSEQRRLKDLEVLGFKDPQDTTFDNIKDILGLQEDILGLAEEKDDTLSGVDLRTFQDRFELPETGVLSLDAALSLLGGPLKAGSKKTRTFFTEPTKNIFGKTRKSVLEAGKLRYKGQVVTPEAFAQFTPLEKEEIYRDYMANRLEGKTDAYGNLASGFMRDAQGNIISTGNDGRDNEVLPIVNQAQAAAPTPTVDPTMFRFLNRGGMVEDAPIGAGIMDLEAARQMMFLGGIAKGIKKGLKGVTRAAKKVFKSPFGKAALLAAPFVMGGGGGGLLSGLKGKLLGLRGVEEFGGKAGLLKDLGLIKGGFGDFGGLTAGGIGSLFGITSLLAALQKPKEDENFDLESYYEKEGLSDFLANLGQRNRFLAEGGKAEPVAKKTMPLLDLDGQEMDFRAEGGFVPIGRMEKADDVPARLSKNEFVFTAEAVRNAGDGDVDKGAEVMYNTMKNLEAGGTMSEESQGQDGAREMFQTAQRLEGVM